MKITKDYALEKLTESNGLFLELFTHGSLSLEVYKPLKFDHQKPHEQDEVYVIIAGKGEFYCGDVTVSFEKGDFLFVPAGIEHRFLNFSDDFSTWVIFYGPAGGENPNHKDLSV
jgi:mannose-6-phosphate isomerase-like protein (cupin superfamily)